MCEYFVVNDRCIVPDIDMFDGHCRDLCTMSLFRSAKVYQFTYFSDEYAPKRVGNRRIYSDQVELDRPLGQPLYFDLQILGRKRGTIRRCKPTEQANIPQ